MRARPAVAPAVVGPGVPEDALDDITTPPKGLPHESTEQEQPSAADSAPEISSEGLAWDAKGENSKSVMPAELAESLSNSGAIPATPRAKNLPPGEDIEGWSESLVGWIPEESKISAVQDYEEGGGSKSTLVLVGVIAAVLVGGGGVAAVYLMSGGEEQAPVAKAPEPEPEPEPEPPVAAAPEPEPASEPEPELVLDEDDLILEGDGTLADEAPVEAKPAPAKKKKTKHRRAPDDVGAPASGPVVQLSANMVRREIAQNMFHVHRCYDSALKRDPSLQGRYSITITIGTNGRVSRAKIDRDSLGHPGVANCVIRKLKKWRFPIHGRLSEPTEVSFPVTFKR